MDLIQSSQSLQNIQTFVPTPQTNSFVEQEIRQRDSTIRRVESTIVQLGEIYQQFSTLVQEQNETVLRIDSHTDNLNWNVSEAHSQLLVYFKHISRRRNFLFKVFAVFLICFILFVWFTK